MANASRRSLRYALILFGVLVVFAVAMGIAPWHRADWALENLLTVVALAFLVGFARRLPLSKVSYTSIFALLMLHTLGSHYTYSEVPYDAWSEALFGRKLNDLLGFERNHYDRLVHFLYGLLIAYPVRELFVRVADVRGFWGYFFPLDVIMSSSMVYELLEWGAVAVVAGDVGQAYLGTQGDEWDAQKDMVLATLGAVIALSVTALVHRRFSRDFHREWADSLRVKHKQPLGEVELARLKSQ
jgi:putative membrane protein